jgi:hypothetical protein
MTAFLEGSEQHDGYESCGEDRERYLGEFRELLDAEEAQECAKDGRDGEGPDDQVHQVEVLGDDRRSRLDAVGQEHPQEHRRRDAAGDPEEQGRDQIAGFDGVVGAFRANDPPGITLAEFALVLGGGDGLPVGEPRAGGGTDAGEDTGPDSDE